MLDQRVREGGARRCGPRCHGFCEARNLTRSLLSTFHLFLYIGAVAATFLGIGVPM